MRNILATLIMAVVLVLTPAIASAEVYGWTWNDPTVTVYDGTFNSNFKVSEAAAEWSRASGIDFVMSSSSNADVVVTEAVTGYLGLAQWTRDSRGNTIRCTIKLDPVLTGNLAEHTALHELGHCGGVDHNRTFIRKSVMNTYGSSSTAVTRPSSYDLREMSRAQTFRK